MRTFRDPQVILFSEDVARAAAFARRTAGWTGC